jgi:adenylate cyclase
MVDIVLEEGGIVDKFIGDSVMAIFGAPLSRPDDPVRAVRCGLRMLDELDQFNKIQQVRGMPTLRIGIGIHTGPLIAGNIGSDKKMEYTVIGDTVNVAARIQTLNKEFKTEFLVSEDTYRSVAAAFPDVRPMEPVQIRGRAHKVMVFEMLRPSERTVRMRPPAPAPQAAQSAPVSDLGIVLGEATQAGGFPPSFETFDVEL